MKNKRCLLQNSEGKRYTCVISTEKDNSEQWKEVFSIQNGYGFTVDCYADRVEIVDYFHGETRASFRILSAEETDEAVDLLLTPVK